MSVRVAIVGTGNIARRHARACQEVAGADLAAVCDVRPEAAEAFGEEFGAPRRHGRLDAMLADGGIDLAIVATWGDSHAEITTALARSGKVKAILCEKPFSLDARQAEAMRRAAAESGVLLAEAFKFRHHPVHLKARELIDAGRIGPVAHVRSTFSSATPPPRRDPGVNWRFHKGHGGGAIYDLGCYCTHHARWTFGDEPVRVHAVGRWGEASGVDEAVTATLEFPSGRSAQWWISFDDGLSQIVEIFGRRGRMRIESAWNNEDQPTALEVIDPDGARERHEFAPVFQFTLQLAHMVECVTTGRPHRIPTDDSVAQMRTLDALYASLRSGQPTALTPAAQEVAR